MMTVEAAPMTSCVDLPGRLRDLCECKGRDGRPDPRPEDCDHWQAAWIAAGVEGVNPPPKRVRQARKSDDRRVAHEPVGTAMAARIAMVLTLKPGAGCGCKTFADEMDKWGIIGCERRRGEIIDRLTSQREKLVTAIATTDKMQSFVRWSLSFGASERVLRMGANWLLDKAIEDVRAMPKPVVPQRREVSASPQVKYLPLIGRPLDRSRLQNHIMYHVMPLAGETEWVWRRHCQWLREVRPSFNGRLIIGIVTPGFGDTWSYLPPEAVKEELRGLDAEFIEAPNDTANSRKGPYSRGGRGEGVLFPLMLEKLITTDPDQIAYYGHCKGVTRTNTPRDGGVNQWAEVMFDTTFRNQTAVNDALDAHGICGPFRMTGGFKDGQPGSGPKPFSGTFFAMRLADVAAGNWQHLPSYYGCVEQWPRMNFDMKTQAACLFLDNPENLYDANYWRSTVAPAFEKWKAERVASRATFPPPVQPKATDHLRRSLMFHCFPKLGTDWRGNCLSTFKYRHVFNGRLLVSVVTGDGCERPETVAEWFEQFQPNLKITYAKNIPGDGINTTFRDQLRAMQNEPGIVFKAHTKGISHVDSEDTWRDNMALGCLGDIPLVEQKFREGFRTFGAYRTTTTSGANVMGQTSGPWAVPWAGWHFPGAFFWFNPKLVPATFFELPSHHYENESFTCHMGPIETSFSLTPDNTNYRKPLLVQSTH